MIAPNFDIENEYGEMIVAGTDEAGRGPLCGPVVAAAVIFKERLYPLELADKKGIVITDSKKMTRIQRETAYYWIVKNTIWSIGLCSAKEIDDINILQASMLAMRRAVDALVQKPDITLVDGNKTPDGLNARAVVKGDSKSLSIAAASIVAKVTRDRIMMELAEDFPEYGWDKNAGYPTKSHIAAMQEYGITKHHRRTYGPVRAIKIEY